MAKVEALHRALLEVLGVVMRGRPPKLSMADKHELRRYREAGVSISRLAAMFALGKRRVLQILAEQRERFGPEQLPKDKRHLVRLNNFTSSKSGSSST